MLKRFSRSNLLSSKWLQAIALTGLMGCGAMAVYLWLPVFQSRSREVNSAAQNKMKPCKATFALVTLGMTRSEVIATVGGPPGFYGRGKLGTDVVTAPRGLGWSEYSSWITNEVELLVLFDKTDRVADIQFFDVDSITEGNQP